MFSQFTGSGFESTDFLDDTSTNTLLAYGQANRGTWSYQDPPSVPEPNIVSLLLAGLAVILLSKSLGMR